MTQEEAFNILKTGLNVFLTGEPGSGKTHTIDRYVRYLRERGIEPAVTASTGIAATHINGVTIHSWSGIGVKDSVSDHDIDLIHSREKTAKRIIDAKILIIDEVSMLDASTLESIDRVLRTLRRRPFQEEQPFGGLQVVFVGDFFQLPPVSRKKTSRFAFESAAWKAANPVVCYLAEQHRQEDGDFLELLKAMRHGTISSAHRARLKSRVGILSKKEVATKLYTHNENVERQNDAALETLEGPTKVFSMTTYGRKPLVESLKQQCLSPETLTLKVGAHVMFTRNNFDAGYVNGTLGVVVGFNSLGAPQVKTRDGKEITVEPAEWAIQDGSKVIARITQLPLRLAWAITVHKSQGMSLDAAVIELSRAFEYGQGYVAISRVRTLSGLFLEGFNERALEMHPKVVAIDRYFRSYSDAARKKFASLPKSEKEKLEKNFLRAIGAKEPSVVKATVSEKSGIEKLREKYPNVGKPWSKDDDALLTKMFKEEVARDKIATHFKRRPTAITARLGHLGLIETHWKPKSR